ncbi:glycoside hydrolase family 64 protein [Xylaria bambusicola]|uniref:glycoside hydrolase family 64 protein n=1 Tax=Xylaria bambusicola TaxID=326684 RepID=UPI00200825E8|nr:glycoside hydrolase family 64 protein [Xylaria bambusicola]KAI0508974.1 glycoside hydrolase family 64 protein [Xylaria bambusicola]
MRAFLGLALAMAGLIGQSFANPTIAHAGGVNDIVITEDNILNSTTVRGGEGSGSISRIKAAQAGAFPIEVHNNFGNGMFMYITGRDTSGAPVLLGANGQYVYPQADGTGVPKEITGNIAIPLNGQGQTTTITLPQALISARIYLANGNLRFFTVRDGNGVSAIVEPSAANPADPSAEVQWGFIEFNYDGVFVFANISFVDFVGIPLGMGVTLATGEQQTVQGLMSGAVNNICNGLKAQTAADRSIWDRLCVTTGSGQALRVLAPNLYESGQPGQFGGYYDGYINDVWNKYSNEDLFINTQTGAGTVSCRVSNNQLNCAGDNRAYPKPTIGDIWGCNSGPFAIIGSDNDVHRAVVPRLCAAFYRSTLLLGGGNVQPSLPANTYYTVNPTSHYARLVHQYEVNGLGYAFSYDDVNPAGENAAGTVSGNNPTLLKVTVGGWS